MRVLLRFACGFAVSAALTLCLLPETAALMLAAGLLLLSLLLGIRRKMAWVPLLGLALGFVWTVGYQAAFVKPAMTLSGRTVEITGTATDYSMETACGVRVPAAISDGNETADAMVWLYTEEPLKPGDRFSVLANIRSAAAENGNYYPSEGIFLLAYGKTEPELTPAAKVPLRYLPRQIAHAMEASLQSCVPADALGYAMALATGNREKLSNHQRENLKTAGIYHALALSGMHMTVLVGFVTMLIPRKRRRAAVGIPLCVAFTIITGAGPSLVRAAVMQCLILLAPVLGKEEDAPTSLGAAALLLTAQNPYCILNWGMQLSFASMTGLVLCAGRIYRTLDGIGTKQKGKSVRARLRHGLCASIAATGAATVCAAPLMMVYFGRISLVAPLTNLLTGWAVAWCFRGSLLTALVGLISQTTGNVLGWCLGWCVRYVGAVAGVLAKLPFASLGTDSVYGFGWVLMTYGIAFVMLRAPKPRRLVIPACCVVTGLAACLMFPMLQGREMTMTVLDVGQGQCLMLSQRGQTVMVDCGGSTGAASGDLAASQLLSVGENRVDVLILTHYDLDHTAGVEELLNRMPVGVILMPELTPEDKNRMRIEAAAQAHGTEVCYVIEEALASFGDGTVRVFPPGPGAEENRCLSILADMGKTQILVTGDMDAEQEHRLMEAPGAAGCGYSGGGASRLQIQHVGGTAGGGPAGDRCDLRGKEHLRTSGGGDAGTNQILRCGGLPNRFIWYTET